ncbi:phosphoribosyltransferase family protein [Pseudonocardia xishanensis]|uniref:Phosphoribosyltransferase family protein n=1 Tax=Pseudonocardia xishanensis TaxID=630995 RepID=A0ABP8RZ02_9PSEU
MSTYRDRVDAGRRLAGRVGPLLADRDPVVLGLPRGGVPVAAEVARDLDAPLDVVVVRKLGVPFQPELAMGALGEGGALVVAEGIVRSARVTAAEFDEVAARARAEVERRARVLRPGARVPLRGRTVLLVDDGIATGSTVRAACAVVRAEGAARVVVAVPVCAADTARILRREVDELVCLQEPDRFAAVGDYYHDFRQISDEEVVTLLSRAAHGAPEAAAVAVSETVEIDADGVLLVGRLEVPAHPLGTVVFAHGSGSSRHSPRNRQVAAALHRTRLATVLVDLLTLEEEPDRDRVFDVALLAGGLAAVGRWARAVPPCRGLPMGYFGASTGAAAALWAAAEDPEVAAVVSRGGRPDLAGARLGSVWAPTLLIVGGRDTAVLALNRRALAELRCVRRLAIVPGATHLFEEPGALARVSTLACDWFAQTLAPAGAPAR